MSQNDDLLNKKQWISMPNDDQATLQPRIASLEYEVIRLEAEKAELFDLVLRAGIHVRHCPNCSEYVLNIVKGARSVVANAEPEDGEGPRK